MDYPIWNVVMGGGVLMAVVAIAHVIVSHFAIGGGLVIAATETVAARRGDREMRELARRGSLVLILVSTVFGAISGVGIWVVAGLISPGAISSLIHNYVWGWAIEWTFFVVEIIAALIYYATWNRISRAAHIMVGWVYFVSAYLSLVVINGIITFMLTPGRWLETHAFWDGFFNPTYWPGLLLRTGICSIMAAAFLLFAVRKAGSADRPRLARYLGWWIVAGALVAYAGYRWWEGALPEPVLGLFRGNAPVVSALATTRSLTLWALTATLAVGVLLVTIPRASRTVAAVVFAIVAFAFFGGYERLREGVRKPFLIHSYLFSNGLRVADIEHVNDGGMRTYSGWVARESVEGEVAHGRAVFRAQCSSCHTLDGYQGIRKALPTVADLRAFAAEDSSGSGEVTFRSECVSCHADYTYDEMRDAAPTADDIRDDPEFARELVVMMVEGTLEELHDMGDFYMAADGTNVMNTHETSRPYMPPLVGSDEDLAALAVYLLSMEQTTPGVQASLLEDK